MLFHIKYFIIFLFYCLIFSTNNVIAAETIDIVSKNKDPIPMLVLTKHSRQLKSYDRIDIIKKQVEKFLSESNVFKFPPIFLDSKINNKTQLYQDHCRAIGCFGVLELDFQKNQRRRGYITIKYSLFDVLLKKNIVSGQLHFKKRNWYKISGKVADIIYRSVTQKQGYFSSYLIYISEELKRNKKQKKIAVTNYGGSYHKFLTDSNNLIAAPSLSNSGKKIAYLSYDSLIPSVKLIDLVGRKRRTIRLGKGITYSPKFSHNDDKLVMSFLKKGSSDIILYDIDKNSVKYLTKDRFLNSSASFSPDDKNIVFISDRSGRRQIYSLNIETGRTKRISKGVGAYGTPIWSPDGKYIAFSRVYRGSFSIGVIDMKNGHEKLLTRGYKDVNPSWAKNSSLLMFTRKKESISWNKVSSKILVVNMDGVIVSEVKVPFLASDAEWKSIE